MRLYDFDIHRWARIGYPENYDILAAFSGAWSIQADKTYIIPKLDDSGFFAYLSLFLSHPSFGPLYKSYTNDADKNVRLTEDKRINNFFKAKGTTHYYWRQNPTAFNGSLDGKVISLVTRTSGRIR